MNQHGYSTAAASYQPVIRRAWVLKSFKGREKEKEKEKEKKREEKREKKKRCAIKFLPYRPLRLGAGVDATGGIAAIGGRGGAVAVPVAPGSRQAGVPGGR